MHRDLAHECLELVRPGHKIRLASDFHQDPDLATGMDIAADDALAGATAGSFRRPRLSTRTQDVNRLLEVATDLG